MGKNKNEVDYVLCLNEDGTITNVKRNKLVKYCKYHIVEFILIPMDDTRQYVVYHSPIKKFDELHITFTTYMSSFDPAGIYDGEDIPIYEKIHDYDIWCKDMIDFAKFLQSMTLLYTVPERFRINNDEYLDSFSIVIESAYIDYLTTDGKRMSERMRDTTGAVRSSFSISEFIASVELLICKNKTSQYMLHPDDLNDEVIVVNTRKGVWSMESIDVDKPDTIPPSMISRDYLFGVFSTITNTISFIPYNHIITLSLASNFDIQLCMMSKINYIDELGNYVIDKSSLSEYLCEKVGYDVAETQLNIGRVTDGDLTGYFEVFYYSAACVYTITDFIMLILNCDRVLSIYSMYNKVIHGELIEYEVIQASTMFGDGKNVMYSFMCEDLNMMMTHKLSYYDRFMKETQLISCGKIPKRFMSCSDEFLRTPPTVLPF